MHDALIIATLCLGQSYMLLPMPRIWDCHDVGLQGLLFRLASAPCMWVLPSILIRQARPLR